MPKVKPQPGPSAVSPASGEEADKVDWSKLPAAALDQVGQHLPALDLVSLGQVCRAWRAATRCPEQPADGAWRKAGLVYEDPLYSMLLRMDLPRGDRELMHRQAGRFCLLVTVAPALGWVKCGKTMRTAARKALMHSDCKIYGLKVNGRLDWTADLMWRQRACLRELTLVNPTLHHLKTAMKMPALESLKLQRDRDRDYAEPVLALPSPAGATQRDGGAHLRTLICEEGVRVEAVDALLALHAASLDEVHVRCLPGAAALAACSALRRLGVRPDPGLAADEQQRVRDALHGQRLHFIGFRTWQSDRHEDGQVCKAFRLSLGKEFLAEDASSPVLCMACAGRVF